MGHQLKYLQLFLRHNYYLTRLLSEVHFLPPTPVVHVTRFINKVGFWKQDKTYAKKNPSFHVHFLQLTIHISKNQIKVETLNVVKRP
jgi:hypothetical protein